MRQFSRGSYLSRITGLIQGPDKTSEDGLDFAYEMGDVVEIKNEDGRRFKAEVLKADPFQQGVVVTIIEELN